ncbi:MAG: PilZ domain-containing protein [Armatimonadetes bacterium]|nr:PilZ domain-containing protein [Armatimonadota bacterium]
MQRVRDARFFGGWTVDYNGRQIVVDTVHAQDLQEGDQFLIQMYGKEDKTMYSAVCTSLGRDWAKFDVQDSPRPFLVQEDVRLRLQLFAKLTHEGFTYEVDVMDVGPNGVGVCGPLDLQKGDTVELAVDTPSGQVDMVGKVRYCIDSGSPFCHRIGLQTEISDRLQKSWWKDLFRDVA